MPSPVKLINHKVVYQNNTLTAANGDMTASGTITSAILAAHNTASGENRLSIRFDALASHDITYVGIIQTARMSGLREFPVPYVLTNCHNSLCAVGGTINEDDHAFGLSAAQKYGGIFVPAHLAVIHAYMRERMASCGSMILGSDSHTRYGALGTLAVGEGGPELVKQLLGRTYDIDTPDTVAVRLTGAPRRGVGPQDVALALIAATFKSGFLKNAALEFVGDGVSALSADFRCGVDVMTTETTCLTTVWRTDDTIRRYYEKHGRPEAYRKLEPEEGAVYDRAVELDLSAVEPMIALPFHPSNAYTIREFNENAADLLRAAEAEAQSSLGVTLRLTDKLTPSGMYVDQGVIAGCAGGTYENLTAAAAILRGKSVGDGGFGLSVYPMSAPVMLGLLDSGAARTLTSAGATLRTAFCGPCFGAGDVPANSGLSIRHSTRNFPNREGSRPADGQIAAVALMDARSIAATAANGGILTGADTLEYDNDTQNNADNYVYDDSPYRSRVYNGFGAPRDVPLVFGPNIADWPELEGLPEHLILRAASVIHDEVTTTDELIPSGETSSYRSNPYKLARFTLGRRDPAYVPFADETARLADEWKNGGGAFREEAEAFAKASGVAVTRENTSVRSVIAANKPGDGSAREQAASCQRVLGGGANIAVEYATKRYRSNLINWGLLPLLGDTGLERGDLVFLPDIRRAVESGADEVRAFIWRGGKLSETSFGLGGLSGGERAIIAAGCLANYYKN